ncbi:MAG: hypothetical protein ACRCW6_01995 [Mycoplasmoidaceae bacterium]
MAKKYEIIRNNEEEYIQLLVNCFKNYDLEKIKHEARAVILGCI